MARRPNINSVLALADKLEPDVRDAFVQAILDARAGIGLAEITAALEAGNVQRVADLLDINARLLYPLDAALTAGFATGAGMVVSSARSSGVVIGFDGRHPRAEAYARRHVGGLIQGLTETQRDGVVYAVRDIVENQLIAGRAPRSAALDLVGRVNRATGRREGGVIGLDDPRAQRLWNVTQGMRTPEGVQDLVQGGKVRYKVNRATEQRILRAYNAGKAVPEADRLISARQYGNQLLRDRGETIAQSEAITALRAGRREGFEQAAEQGAVVGEEVEREWDTTMDGRERDSHGEMNGKKIKGLDEAWVLPSGARVMYPGDKSLGAPAKETTRCRCYERYRANWIRNG